MEDGIGLTHRAAKLALVSLLASALLGCGIDNLFATPGLETVTLNYMGDTLLTLDSIVPFNVVVTAGGTTQSGLRLVAASSDTTVVGFTAGFDSLVPRSIGRADITFRVMAGIFTDSQPTLVQGVRVRP